MNLPNKLTVLRMALIPVFLLFMFNRGIPGSYFWAMLVFAVASFTDFLDGYIARKNKLVTDFGKLMDPLADKLLVFAALICFQDMNITSPLVVFIILAREFLVTSVRLIAAEKGIVIAADRWGKMKTIFQMMWVLYALLGLSTFGIEALLGYPAAFYTLNTLQWIVVALTVYSGCNYIIKNRSLFADK